MRYVNLAKRLGLLLMVTLVVGAVFIQCQNVNATTIFTTEYEKFVHTNINSQTGNSTIVDKPMFPIYFEESQIAIGGNWSIIEPLVANQSYHVYCYGDWVNDGSNPQTNYDLYVYDPNGNLESEHTRAAGLAEQLSTGTNASDLFFVPKKTGNYTFVIINNAGSSNGTEAATFMVIESLETNKWYSRYIEGRNPDSSTKASTSWGYEFVTDREQIEIFLKIPDSLDMYEARLYTMSDSQSSNLHGLPLPLEQGLYGNTSGTLGGYSLDSNQFRGVAYASCEYRGEDMAISYSNPTGQKILYHLVLIGESGSGNVEFLIKTHFDDISLSLIEQRGRIYPTNQTTITCISKTTQLKSATLKYTVNNWQTNTELEMEINQRNCTAIIPNQLAGSVVQYIVVAKDELMNTITTTGNYSVRRGATLTIFTETLTITEGENATISGSIIGANGSAKVTVLFMNALTTDTAEIMTLPDGTFTVNFLTNSSGRYAVQASFFGSDTTFSADSNQLVVEVEEKTFFAKNGIYLGGGFFGAVGIAGLIMFIRKRRQ